MLCVGADYSAQEAFLALSDGETVQHTFKLKLAGDLSEQRRDYLDLLARTFSACLKLEIKPILFMEQPWIAGAHFPQAGLKLARNAAYIEVSALAVGMDVRFVHVSTWRKAVYGNGKPQDPKGTAVSWVLYNLGFETKNHNLAEAACIATYGAKHAGE